MDRLISEQAVLNLIADYDLSMGQVVKGIHALPSVNLQEQKTGHWDKKDLGHVEYSAVCSECGEWTYWSERSNFCPNCGCHMIESQESEDVE